MRDLSFSNHKLNEMANFQYNIENRLLTGRLEGTSISVYAGSGGRSGSKVVEENLFLANNSLATHIGGEKNQGTHNFGPIPIGIYTLKIHEQRKNWIRLIHNKSNSMYGRNGFAIHGRGSTGSHGCIVPEKFQIILDIIKVLKENPQKTYTLEVISRGPHIGWQNRIA